MQDTFLQGWRKTGTLVNYQLSTQKTPGRLERQFPGASRTKKIKKKQRRKEWERAYKTFWGKTRVRGQLKNLRRKKMLGPNCGHLYNDRGLTAGLNVSLIIQVQTPPRLQKRPPFMRATRPCPWTKKKSISQKQTKRGHQRQLNFFLFPSAL